MEGVEEFDFALYAMITEALGVAHAGSEAQPQQRSKDEANGDAEAGIGFFLGGFGLGGHSDRSWQQTRLRLSLG